jgi:RimJ/RimL family protein N-acetyltransferase
MDISVTLDMQMVRDILMEPDIWERAAEDGVDKESFYPGTDAFSIWLLCLEENEAIGIILVHTDTSVSVKMHPYLRKKHRQKGRAMMKAFYEWMLESTDTNKINVTIPECEQKVINFAKKVGFKKEGLNRDSYQKNGQLYGQQNLGITRHEIEEYLRWAQ